MKITLEEIAEYRELSKLVHKSLLRMKEIDSKIPKLTDTGGNYMPIRNLSERDTNSYLKK